MRKFKIELKEKILEDILRSDLNQSVYKEMKSALKGLHPKYKEINEKFPSWILIGHILISKKVLDDKIAITDKNFERLIKRLSNPQEYNEFMRVNHNPKLKELADKINQKKGTDKYINRIEQAKIYFSILREIKNQELKKTKTLKDLKIQPKKRSILQYIINNWDKINNDAELKNEVNVLSDAKVYELLKNMEG